MQKTQTTKNTEGEQVLFIGQRSQANSKIIESDEVIIEEEFEDIKVVFRNLNSERVIKIETHYFVMEVVSCRREHRWEIQRRYSDFQWLFNALNFSYPGCILPYFPVKTIQNFMVTKLGIQYGQESKEQHLNLRKDQLEVFLNGVCHHQLLKQAQETKIFLRENKQEFIKKKKAIESQISQSQSQGTSFVILESSSNGIVSMFQRGVAWITSSKQQTAQKIQSIQGWQKMESQIRLWIYQYSALIQKVEKLIQIKRAQAEWRGPQTEVDSVEQLKARVVSGQNFNKIFQEDLSENVIKNIEYEAKCLKQIQNQLEYRENIISIINYVYKFSNSNNRSNKLLRKKQKFQINMTKEWPILKESLRCKIRSVQKKFNQVWVKYCRNVHKIWKQK